mgnify:CR=1 FL=1
MSKKTYKYLGSRRGKHGIEKVFDSNSLDEAKVKRLEEKGWEEVKSKPKSKPQKSKEKE